MTSTASRPTRKRLRPSSSRRQSTAASVSRRSSPPTGKCIANYAKPPTRSIGRPASTSTSMGSCDQSPKRCSTRSAATNVQIYSPSTSSRSRHSRWHAQWASPMSTYILCAPGFAGCRSVQRTSSSIRPSRWQATRPRTRSAIWRMASSSDSRFSPPTARSRTCCTRAWIVAPLVRSTF